MPSDWDVLDMTLRKNATKTNKQAQLSTAVVGTYPDTSVLSGIVFPPDRSTDVRIRSFETADGVCDSKNLSRRATQR